METAGKYGNIKNVLAYQLEIYLHLLIPHWRPSFWQTDPSTELSIHLDKCIKLNGLFVLAEDSEPLIPGDWLLLLVSSLTCPLTEIHWHLLEMVDGWLICNVLPATLAFQNSKYAEL